MEKQKIEITKQKAKAPTNRPNAVPSSKPPHRTFSTNSKTWQNRLGR